MAEATRLMIDIAGGFVADLPSDRDFENPEIGPLLKKYLKGALRSRWRTVSRCSVWSKNWPWKAPTRFRISTAAVRPAAHRLTIFRESNTKDKIKAAKRLAGIES